MSHIEVQACGEEPGDLVGGQGTIGECQPSEPGRDAAGLTGRPIAILHAAHSGVIGDYAAWVAGGAALFAVVWGATLR